MKISGFTIIKNAVLNDYPVVESIRSILPVVDEMIVSVGKSDDETESLIRSIQSDKIKIIQSEWDPALRQGGKILAVETNKAFHQIARDSDWAFYIQADEVVRPVRNAGNGAILAGRDVLGRTIHIGHIRLKAKPAQHAG